MIAADDCCFVALIYVYAYVYIYMYIYSIESVKTDSKEEKNKRREGKQTKVRDLEIGSGWPTFF